MEIITNIPDEVMQLSPEFEIVQREVTVDTSAPQIEKLNVQQRTAFDRIYQYATDELDPARAILLEGYAGTGKTFTIAQLVKKLILMRHRPIAITAPTNKAVKVLKRTTGYKHDLLSFRTIHALLGLKEVIDENGVQSFQADPSEPREIEDVSVLIVDETSMLPDELFLEISKCIDSYGLKVIFMGDPIQIPPVNKPDCIPFIDAHRKTYDIERLELTEIVRQKEGNPILELATLVRENIYLSDIPYAYRTQMTSQGGIIMIERTDKAKLYQLCEHYFGNARFNLDPDFVKVIAWTNKTVDFMNRKIREMIYKDQELKKIMVGEKLIADKPIIKRENTPWGEKDKILFTTNDEFEVLSYELTQVNAFGNFDISVYRTTVQMIDHDGKKKTHTIDIIHESGEELYRHVLKVLRNQAINEKDKAEKKMKWRNYYAIQNKFAEVKYNYAITAHKSQGSTYENVIVIEPDMDYNRKIVERNRIKYVAYTRASRLLFIVK